jgi:hypothetical protein
VVPARIVAAALVRVGAAHAEGKLRLDADITKVARWLGRAAAQGNAGAAAALRAFAAAHVPAAVALVRCLRHEARGGGARRLYAQRTHR